MVKKIRLLGMEIDNFTLREEMKKSKSFYDKQELNIIRTVSVKMLSMAAQNQIVRDGIAQADLIVVGDREILTEAGIYSAQRLREASEQEFMTEFLKESIHCGGSFFLVAQSQAELASFLKYLKIKYENMRIVGNYVLDACGKEYDMMINEINAAAPDIILSALSSPQEDAFLMQEKAKISARVWYSVGTDFRVAQKKPSFFCRFQQLIHKGRFKNVIHNYEDRHE